MKKGKEWNAEPLHMSWKTSYKKVEIKQNYRFFWSRKSEQFGNTIRSHQIRSKWASQISSSGFRRVVICCATHGPPWPGTELGQWHCCPTGKWRCSARTSLGAIRVCHFRVESTGSEGGGVILNFQKINYFQIYCATRLNPDHDARGWGGELENFVPDISCARPSPQCPDLV